MASRPETRALDAGAPARRARRGAAQKSMTIGAVCKALAAGVPRHLDLQDPLPRGPEAAHAAAHAGRLPAVHAGRRRAAAHDPAPAARRVPAAAGDPPGAGGRPHAPTRRRRRRGDRRRRRARGAASVSVRSAAPLYTLEDVLEETRRRRRSWCASWRTSASSRARSRGGVQVLRRDRARDHPRRRPSWRATASAAATCACSAPRPTARPALLQQILAPALRSRNPERRKEAVEALENLAAVATHLKHLLLVRDLRKIAR